MGSRPIADDVCFEIRAYMIEGLPNMPLNIINSLVDNLKNEALSDIDPADIVLGFSNCTQIEMMSLVLEQDDQVEKSLEYFIHAQHAKLNFSKAVAAMLIVKSREFNQANASFTKLYRVLTGNTPNAANMCALYSVTSQSPKLIIDLIIGGHEIMKV